MADDHEERGRQRELRYEDGEDPSFQRRLLESRHLEADDVQRAFRHGFDARDRFADRPFAEAERYLRESWEGMGGGVPWEDVSDIVRSGYERYKGATMGESTDLPPEAGERTRE